MRASELPLCLRQASRACSSVRPVWRRIWSARCHYVTLIVRLHVFGQMPLLSIWHSIAFVTIRIWPRNGLASHLLRLTSCILRISPNREPTSLMSSSMSSEIRIMGRVHPGQAMLRLPLSTRYVICRCISAIPSFCKHSIHWRWAASVSSSARASAASVAAFVSCAVSTAVYCVAIVSACRIIIAYAVFSLLIIFGPGESRIRAVYTCGNINTT